MTIGVVFVLAAMLLSSGNPLNSSFAQTGTGGTGGNNEEEQNYEDFTECLTGEEGTKGYATEQQIRECFAPIYNTGTGTTGADNGDDNGDDNDNS